MKRIILIRHAIAMEREDFHKNKNRKDSDRPLTKEGKTKFTKDAKKIIKLFPEVQVLWTSSFLRAKDTAKILKKTKKKLKVVLEKDLEVGGSITGVIKKLKVFFRTHDMIFLVGHEPDLSKLISKILGQSKMITKMKKGGVVVLECKDATLRESFLKAILEPKNL